MPYDLFLSFPEVQPKDLRLRVRAPSGGGAVAYARTATEAVSPPVSSAQRRIDVVRATATLGVLAGDQALRVLALARRAGEVTGLLDEALRIFAATREVSEALAGEAQASRQVSVARRSVESSALPTAVASKELMFGRDLSVPISLTGAASRTVDIRRLGLELSAVLVTTSVRTQELMRAAGETVDQVQALSVRELLTARGPSVLLDVSDTTTRVVVVARVAAVETLAVAGVERVVSYGREALDQVLLMQGITVGFLVLRRRPVRLALQATGPALTFAIVEHLS